MKQLIIKETEREREQKINTENYLKKKKYINREYGRNRYHNMSEENKKRLKEYQKNYREAKKSIINNLFYSNQPRHCDVIS